MKKEQVCASAQFSRVLCSAGLKEDAAYSDFGNIDCKAYNTLQTSVLGVRNHLRQSEVGFSTSKTAIKARGVKIRNRSRPY